MLLDYVQYKKNHITVSEFDSSNSLSGLQTIHTGKTITDTVWAVSDTPDLAWIKLNLYETSSIEQIDFTFTGSFTDATIEGSIDNTNWETISSAFSTSDDSISLTYSDIKYQFVKITFTDPTTFIMTDLGIYGTVTMENEHFISHANDLLYPEKFRSDYPILPSINKSILEMLEAQSDIDLTLFDDSVFATSSVDLSYPTDVSLSAVALEITSDTTIDGNLILSAGDNVVNISSGITLSYIGDDFSVSGAQEFSITGDGSFAYQTNHIYGTVVTITPNNIPYISGAQYILDFDEEVYSWEASTAYSTSFQIFEDGYVWEATTSGTSDSSDPDWDSVTSDGSTITDGTITWTRRSPSYISDNNPPKISMTTVPGIKTYTYNGLDGVYYPRFIIKTNDYQLEWVNKFTKTS